MRILSALAFALFLGGCATQDSTIITRFHDDGRAKPVVVLPSMIDTSCFDVSWSLSEELTSIIADSLKKGGKIFLQSQEDSTFSANPFAGDFGWMKTEFPDHEFAVFLELAEHEFASSENSSGEELANNLKMGIRIRVVDLRGGSPKIVLQEIVRDSYYIPKTLLPTDYSTITWGSEEYRKSPMGTAHGQIAREVAARVSEYVLLAKSSY
ncbi:MAG: hypothetical protein FJZ64_03590 [Chlamydiae bacterium]|nr:hypothetical protein [Chlamydiota bacterium]